LGDAVLRTTWLPVVAGCLLAAAWAAAQQPGDAGPAAYPATSQALAEAPKSPYPVAEQSDPAREVPGARFGTPDPNEHPLTPFLGWARSEVGNIEKMRDYSAILVARERIGGELGDYQHMYIKVRHDPFSVYVYVLGPKEIRGREVTYVEGRTDNKRVGPDTGIHKLPITELGMLNLLRGLIEVGERDFKYGECTVKFYKNAKVNKRPCTCIEIVHPYPRRNFLFHVARIFVDDELNLPIRYESYDWPKEEGGRPQLAEEYTYVNVKLNNGLTDLDFDRKVREVYYPFHNKATRTDEDRGARSRPDRTPRRSRFCLRSR